MDNNTVKTSKKRPFLALHFFGITLNKLTAVILGLIGIFFFGGIINAFGAVFFVLGIIGYIADFINGRKKN